MKIKAVTIRGMHKVGSKRYELNDNVTYFIGPNGVGKSTILEAIQLALLGYIPGYAKTNESIMKHSSNPSMSITLEFDDGSMLSRTWARSGSSVTSTVDNKDLAAKIQASLSDIELPIFDFNEFRSMTANKLKEWFIQFLPDSNQQFDLVDELRKDASTRSLPFEDILAGVQGWMSDRPESGVELIKALNSHFKEDQTYIKGQISKLQGTIESLVRYDDAVDEDEEELKQTLELQHQIDSQLLAYEAKEEMNRKSEDMYDQAKARIDAMKAALPAESADKDPRIADMKKEIETLNQQVKIMQADNNDIRAALSELVSRRMSISPANPICPYTKNKCETATALADKLKSEADELDKQIAFKKEEEQECSSAKISELQSKIQGINLQIAKLENDYTNLASLESNVAAQPRSIDIGPRPTTLTHDEIAAESARINNILIKIEANKRYDKLSKTVVADKFKLENELEVLKGWIKLTDANGLQSSLMNKPFEDLADEMSSYLTSMFNAPTEAKFNLLSKANSFSFGVNRDNQYIEFDYLSSGERCLFTLALILCIINKCSTDIKTILIDDILDHLDTNNAEYLFDALTKIEGVQFILAGVKGCSNDAICKIVT